MLKRRASAVWNGDIQQGSGKLSAPGGALNQTPYSYATRFGDANGTNPEELIAASHAGCFSMALSFQLQNAGYKADEINTTVTVYMERDERGLKLVRSEIVTRARVSGIDAERFASIAADAKANCPISRVLNLEITLDAELVA
ncbi:MAG: OsmC family protein [Lysobacterales bacterium]